MIGEIRAQDTNRRVTIHYDAPTFDYGTRDSIHYSGRTYYYGGGGMGIGTSATVREVSMAILDDIESHKRADSAYDTIFENKKDVVNTPNPSYAHILRKDRGRRRLW